MKARFTRLCSFALNEDISVASVFAAAEDLTSLFCLPLSQQAFGELENLKIILDNNTPSQGRDEWAYCWGQKYIVGQFYLKVFSTLTVPMSYTLIWQTCCTMNYKVFAWLLLRDRLNTKDMLKRRHWNVAKNDHCVLCPIQA